ncbi:hypothetical protein HIM_02005 [Hirsutella minnesotensis 3608]|nr:hypothetical protein HIM_02005 [Hirsutella minnesotensis 3608]
MHMGDSVVRDDGRPAKRIKIEAPPPTHAVESPDDQTQIHGNSPLSLTEPSLVLPLPCPPDGASPTIDANSGVFGEATRLPPQPFPPLNNLSLESTHIHRPQRINRHRSLHLDPPHLDTIDDIPPHLRETPEHVHSPTNLVMATVPTTTTEPSTPWAACGGASFPDDSWRWPSAPGLPSSQMVLGLLPPSSSSGNNTFHPYHAPSTPAEPLAPTLQSVSSALPAADLDTFPLSPTRASVSTTSSRLQKRPRYSIHASGGSNLTGLSSQVKDESSPKSPNSLLLVSPFKDCVGNFGEAQKRRFSRPYDGKVNGYIKFNWPKEKDSRRHSVGRESPGGDSPNVTESIVSYPETADTPCSSLIPLGPSPAASITPISFNEVDQSFDFTNFLHGPVSSTSFEQIEVVEVDAAATTGGEGSNELAPMGAPRKVPNLFGYEAQMDQTDRKFWTFYIRNWCPGRSVLLETNLWLKDFAQMHKSDGVRAAIQSLAGIYIYDYQPIDSIRKRVNERFCEAELRFSRLLNDPTTGQNEGLANELITMAVILSMQDIVLTERRLRKPHNPRWLSGFKHGETFLQATDHGSRFWKRSNAQLSSLRISQSIIVGRAMILAQPMMRLPSPDTFDPEYETSRFGWLLYGTEQDMYQIHGGCGFSKKLLHMMSQITYCAARLQQDPGNIVVPTTTQYLHAELIQMRQWSPESKDWETAKAGPSVTEWVRSVPDGYMIGSSAEMTDVTAEAWRLMAIVYLQCRVLRIPRNHPAVLENLSDLARCIRIMPTSGYQFTAQAPLFPVFLLGMLGTAAEHRNVSRHWFDEVVSTPVRSSVPPLYEVLQRIWQWIDIEIEPPASVELANHIGLRHAWWEQLVREVDRRENEVLCLT